MHEFSNQKPLYIQLKEIIELSILNGLLKSEEAVPSIRILSKDYQLNPLTVSSAIDSLVNDGILYKKRGIGMFVSPDAKEKIQKQQIGYFRTNELISTIKKARSLGMVIDEIEEIITDIFKQEEQ